MKMTPKQYAQALFLATEHKTEQEANDVIKRFADRLRSDGQLGKLPAVIAAFSAIWNKAHGVTDAEVVSRERLNEDALAAVKQFIQTRYGSKQVVVINSIDATIGGGIIIRVGDELLDGSVATQLNKLKRNLAGTGITQS